MFLIDCPHCGARDESEFSCGGEAHIIRPPDPDQVSDEQWAEYLFLRSNPKGLHLERWVHEHGCRRWFNVCRNTVTHEIVAVYAMGTQPPNIGARPDAHANASPNDHRNTRSHADPASVVAGGSVP